MSYLDVLENSDDDSLVQCGYLKDQDVGMHSCKLGFTSGYICKRDPWHMRTIQGHDCFRTVEQIEVECIEQKNW